MDLLLWGITLGTVGKLVLGIAVLRVHVRIFEEHRIDNVVLRAIKREQFVTLLGIIFIVLGYVLEISFYASSPALVACSGVECASALQAALTAQH